MKIKIRENDGEIMKFDSLKDLKIYYDLPSWWDINRVGNYLKTEENYKFI